MQNTCPNPTCGAMYNLTSQHIGRSFACKKCGSTLVVTATGLELAGAQPVGTEPVVQPLGEEPSPMRSRPSVGIGAGAAFAQFWERIKSDASTWLLGVGLFFVVVCLFWPLLDRAKIDRREAKISAGERKLQRLEEKIRAESDQKEKEKLQKSLDDTRKKWQENEKPKLQEDLDDMRDSAKSWRYWYDWGMMWGFLFLGYAALGYLTPQQPTIRRVVGSIVLCAMLLLIFIRFVIESAVKSSG